jgi:hypothetical protein
MSRWSCMMHALRWDCRWNHAWCNATWQDDDARCVIGVQLDCPSVWMEALLVWSTNGLLHRPLQFLLYLLLLFGAEQHGHEDMRLSSAGTHLSIHWWGGLWLAVGRIWQRFGRQQPPGIAHAVIATCMEIDRCDVVGTAWLWMHHPSTYYRLQLASRLYILDVDGMHKLSYNISLHSRRTSV